MQQDRTISVLIGLVGACNNNSKTENTDSLVLEALATEKESDELVERIRAEKYRISPGCATCATPCGNTSDFDMNRIYNAEPTIRNLKQRVLAEICQLAAFVLQNDVKLSDSTLFYKTLSYVSYDLNEQTLLALLDEIRQEKLMLKGE